MRGSSHAPLTDVLQYEDPRLPHSPCYATLQGGRVAPSMLTGTTYDLQMEAQSERVREVCVPFGQNGIIRYGHFCGIFVG